MTMHDRCGGTVLRRRPPPRWALTTLLLLTGCFFYPDSSERIEDEITYTHYDDATNFGAFTTFAVDPVVHLATVQADNSVESGTLDPVVGDQLVAQVVNNMKARGYVQVDASMKPNLGITLTAISGLTIGVISGGYYWGYYGYYWGYPGWGYYYPYDVAYSYRTGTLAVDMVDLVKADGKFQRDGGVIDRDAGPGPGALPVVWTAAAYQADVDVANPSNLGVQKALQVIDQAFKQSPYLQRSM